MRKLWLVLLSLALTINCAAGFAMAEEAPLPQVGDVIHGFEVMEVGEFPLIDADVVLFEHQKTGAKLMYLANEDPNRTFELNFRTPAPDDTGIPHVFEHSTLDGSEKYPSKSLFFNLIYQTYNTYMYAATSNIMTMYPVASLSERQLLKYADYYTDSCLHPMIYEDESIFMEEAWRYALSDPEDELTIAGTVYSEMTGGYTLDEAASLNGYKTLFPGSSIGNSYGGIPEKIPEMTWEHLLDYHQAYYHPSNSLACLYGSFDDYAAFLELLDGYYAAYDRAEIRWDDPDYTPLTGPVTKTFEYGVESGSEASASVYYGLILEGASEADLEALNLTAYFLDSEALPLVRNLRAELPAASLQCYLEKAGPEPALIFIVSNVQEGDEAAVKRVVDDSLRQIVAEGFDPALVDAIAASVRIDALLATESSSVGVDVMPDIAYCWAMSGDVNSYMKFVASLNDLEQMANSGALTTALEKYALNAQRTALALTQSVPGLKEEQDAALKAKLADVKAAMSDEEIDAIIARTLALANGPTGEDGALVAQLKGITVEELPEEVRVYDVTDEVGEDSVRRMDMKAHADGLGQALVMLDASLMEQEDLHWFKLYTDLLGSMGTREHSREELASLITRYLYSNEIRPSVMQEKGAEHCDLRMRASWIGFDEDMAAAYDLIYEILFETQFADLDALRDAVAITYDNLGDAFSIDTYQHLLTRAESSADAASALYNYMTEVDYYAFLGGVLDQMEQEPDEVIRHLVRVQGLLYNRTDAISGYAGGEEGAAIHRAAADAFFQRLDVKPIEKHDYQLPQCAQSEALILNSPVQYNMVFASYDQLGLDGFSGDLDVMTSLMADAFLQPMLRDQYGVYDVIHFADDQGLYAISYRDMNIAETFEVYEMMPDAMAEMAEFLDQETLDGYIMAAYVNYARPSGELSGALSAMLDLVEGRPGDEKLTYMRSLKDVTVESMRDYVQIYQNLLAHGLRATAGSASAIDAHKELYERIIPVN